ncbi:MAG: ABC transporter permease [Clostridiales bacterium]|nr:ABC transporter permease [Clostridiales bacterium]
MHKIRAFALRNWKEILRDPLSYIFCLGFPMVMLVIMTLVDRSIPAQVGMTIFHIENLSGGIMVFGLTFVMLFTAITVAKDRSGAFLLRMYASPMTAMDFVLGYLLPMLCIALLQALLIGICSMVVSLLVGNALSISGVLLAVVTAIPSAVFFIGLGLLFGTLCNDKAAPGLCSIVISLGSFLGSIWFDAEATGGVLLKISRCLPFHYCTKSLRAAVQLNLTGEAYWAALGITAACALVMTLLAAAVFRGKMRAEMA